MASANVLRTIFTYPISGLGPYTIAFDYLARKFVQVTLLGPDRKLLVLGTDYRFIATKQIQLINAAPAGYAQIEIRRYTDAQDRLVDFQDGSILRATDLNVSQVQTMHIAEEGRDVAGNTLGVDSDGNLDARLRKMVNLLDGNLDGDAVTVRQMKSWSESALNQAGVAKQQADLAIAAAQGAKTSETNSATTATNSANSATLAQKWAANPQGVLVDASKYSAYHYALASEQSATSAQGSASSASQDATATAADRVQTGLDRVAADDSANKAKTEADKLGNMNDFAAALNSVGGSPDYRVNFKGAATFSKGSLIVSDGGITATKEINSTLGISSDTYVTVGKDGKTRSTAYLRFKAETEEMNFTLGVSDVGYGPQWGLMANKTQYVRFMSVGDLSFYAGDLHASSRVYCTNNAWLQGDGNIVGSVWALNLPGNNKDAYSYVQWAAQNMGPASDRDFKNSIVDSSEGAGKRIDALRPREFTWNEDQQALRGVRALGFIAQEAQEVSELYAHDTGLHMILKDHAIMADLVSEVQSLRKRVKELELK